jgi:hypothetical protein
MMGYQPERIDRRVLKVTGGAVWRIDPLNSLLATSNIFIERSPYDYS